MRFGGSHRSCFPRGSEERRDGRSRFPSLAIVCAFLPLFIPSMIAAAGSEEWEHPTRIGLVAGAPQLLALTADRAITGPARVQVHASYLIRAFSCGARVVLESNRGWGALRPYAFAGGGYLIICGAEGEDDFWDGEGLFVWAGGGLRLRIGRFSLCGELGKMNWHSTYHTRRYPGDRERTVGSFGLFVDL